MAKGASPTVHQAKISKIAQASTQTTGNNIITLKWVLITIATMVRERTHASNDQSLINFVIALN